jgi:excisionase family DNA binding protein
MRGAEHHIESPTLPILVSKRVAAALLGVCVRTVDNLIATKQLPRRRIGKRVLIPYSTLVAFARRDHLWHLASQVRDQGKKSPLTRPNSSEIAYSVSIADPDQDAS